MKKLIVFLLSGVYLLGGGIALAIDDPSDPGIKLEWRGKKLDESVKEYILVAYSAQGTDDGGNMIPSIDSGDVVVWDTSSADGVNVSESSTSADGAIAGIAAMVIQTSDGGGITNARNKGYGYIQVRGRALATIDGANGATAGDVFYTSSDFGRVGRIDTTQSANDAGRTARGQGGFFLSAPGEADSQAVVYVNL